MSTNPFLPKMIPVTRLEIRPSNIVTKEDVHMYTPSQNAFLHLLRHQPCVTGSHQVIIQAGHTKLNIVRKFLGLFRSANDCTCPWAKGLETATEGFQKQFISGLVKLIGCDVNVRAEYFIINILVMEWVSLRAALSGGIAASCQSLHCAHLDFIPTEFHIAQYAETAHPILKLGYNVIVKKGGCL